MLSFTLPWPPTVNHYWQRRKGGGYCLSKAGKTFRENAIAAIWHTSEGRPRLIECRVAVAARFYPPDHQERDVDNVLKPLLDALQHAGVIRRDFQVTDLHAFRRGADPPGRVRLHVIPLRDAGRQQEHQLDRHPLVSCRDLLAGLAEADRLLGGKSHPTHKAAAIKAMGGSLDTLRDLIDQWTAEVYSGRYSPLAD
jgi:crossover junction endodeoxyribonuclease RusA